MGDIKVIVEDRLLSENAVMKSVQKALIEMGYEPLGDEVQKIFEAIENTKNAYDLEKVVEQLKHPNNYTIVAGNHYTTVDRAVGIVRAGGKEQMGE